MDGSSCTENFFPKGSSSIFLKNFLSIEEILSSILLSPSVIKFHTLKLNLLSLCVFSFLRFSAVLDLDDFFWSPFFLLDDLYLQNFSPIDRSFLLVLYFIWIGPSFLFWECFFWKLKNLLNFFFSWVQFLINVTSSSVALSWVFMMSYGCSFLINQLTYIFDCIDWIT